MSIDIWAAWFARDEKTDSCGFVVDCSVSVIDLIYS